MEHKIEKIYWRDIAGLSDKWMTKEELCIEAQKNFDALCSTVGTVIFENNEYVIICPTLDGDDKFHDSSMIMKSVIVRREKWTKDGN